MSINLSALQKQRRDTAANWTAENPTLLAGEIGLESDTGYWKVGDGSTAWTSLAYVTGLGAEIPVSRLADGTARQLLQTAANGNDVEWTSNVDVPGTLDVTGAATFDAAVTIQGDLTVNGTTTTIDTQNLIVEDKNVIIGNVTTPTDVTADGGGITLKGTTDKTINWVDATDAWTLSEHVNIASAKEYRIDGTKVLDANSLGSSVLITSANITDGTIVNGDINASAAIAGTKISPDFGSQNVTTTGTSTAASFIPTSSTAPTNGLYLSAANSVGISTNSTGRLFIDSSGNVGVGGSVGFGAIDHGIHVTGSGAQEGIRLQTSAGSSGILEVYAESGGATLDTRGSGYIRFNNATTEWARVDSSGRLGIGTSSPSTKTHLYDASNVALKIESGGANYVETNFINTSAAYTLGIRPDTSNSLCIRDNTASATRVVLDSSGRLGIGTTNPSESLTVGSGNVQVNNGQLALGVFGTSGLQLINDGTIGTVNSLPLIFRTGATERGRFDTSGRLLVGTSSGSLSYSSVVVRGNPAASGVQGTLELSRASLPSTNGAGIGTIAFTDSSSNLGATIAAIAEGSWTSGSNHRSRLEFSTTADGASSPTERMRITNSGRLRSFGSDNIAFELATSSAAGTTNLLFSGNYGASGVGGGTESIRIFSNGNVQNTNNSYGAISDIKLKENIADANSQWDDLKALQVRNYNFKEGQTHTQIGLIAQEVELVSPGLVTESPDRDADGNDLGTVTKSVNYSVLYMKAVKALQEAMERIEVLEAKVAALETQ